MASCLFCRVASGAMGTDFLLEDERIVAFRDLHPQAPDHVLILPKEHIATLDDATETHEQLLGHILLTASQLAKQLGLSAGYRTVFNCNAMGGQSVYHLHLHLLGGRAMGWPPG